MSYAICFNLDQPKILSSGNGWNSFIRYLLTGMEIQRYLEVNSYLGCIVKTFLMFVITEYYFWFLTLFQTSLPLGPRFFLTV